MAESNLKFGDSFTVEQFKRMQGVDKIHIKTQAKRDEAGNILKDANGKTMFHDAKDNKLFFAFGNKTGAVSKQGIPSKPMISEVTDINTGECFFMLHEESKGGAPTLASL